MQPREAWTFNVIDRLVADVTAREAMAQGPMRLARGHNFFNAMAKLAAERGWAFNWRVVETPGIGHNGARMFKAAEVAEALFGPAAR